MTMPDRPRPRDWAPLAASDPLPGSPAEIAAEARRLKNMAAEMRSQIATLRQIGNEPALVGQYADKLRTSSTDLAGKLEKVVGRYEQVSGHLEKWGPELATYQASTVEALQKAKAAEQIRTANAPAAVTLGPPAPAVAAPAAARAAQCALDDAECMLRQARDQMTTAVEDARRRGREIADLIEDATNDDVKDGRWDRFKSWVDRNAGWIKGVSDALGWVATGIAVVSIAIVLVLGTAVPGLNVLMWSAFAATLFAAMGHGALAASGNGSRLDFALDVFALVTFGTGRMITGGLQETAAATRAAAATSAKRAAREGVLESTRAAREAAGRTLADRQASAAARRAAQGLIDDAHRQASRAGVRAAREIGREPLPTLQGLRTFRAGDSEASQLAKQSLDLRARFASSSAVQAASDRAASSANRGLAAFGAGTFADVGDKVATVAAGEQYGRFKERYAHEVGSTW
ncbi:MAG TPA: hypothetical protein VMZ00_12415 [Sporichthya sp.]|nr:hypothetical protein [Sporichthya sp.]